MRIKICGITQAAQGQAIAHLGATALGFICVESSSRYVSASSIAEVVEALPHDSVTAQPSVDRVGVFVDASIEHIMRVVTVGRLNGVQLHGQESAEFCRALRQALAASGPSVEIIKAFRVRSLDTLEQAYRYCSAVDMLLLDAYHPTLLGGTGQTLNWKTLQSFQPDCPWLLAGGLTPDNVLEALRHLQPDGIDLSSGVERSPGNKDLNQVKRLFSQLKQVQQANARPA